MEFAQENSQRQEESMQRLRECIADLPPEVDTRALERSLDEHQGTPYQDNGTVVSSPL